MLKSNFSEIYSKSSGDWVVSNSGKISLTISSGIRTYGCVYIKIDIPEVPYKLEDTISLYYGLQSSGQLGTGNQIRYALCTSDLNRDLYNNTCEDIIEDEYMITSGVWVNNIISNTSASKSIPAKWLQSGRSYYLFLWLGSNNATVATNSTVTISLGTKNGEFTIPKAAGPYIFIGGRVYRACISDETSWSEYTHRHSSSTKWE